MCGYITCYCYFILQMKKCFLICKNVWIMNVSFHPLFRQLLLNICAVCALATDSGITNLLSVFQCHPYFINYQPNTLFVPLCCYTEVTVTGCMVLSSSQTVRPLWVTYHNQLLPSMEKIPSWLIVGGADFIKMSTNWTALLHYIYIYRST